MSLKAYRNQRRRAVQLYNNLRKTRRGLVICHLMQKRYVDIQMRFGGIDFIEEHRKLLKQFA